MFNRLILNFRAETKRLRRDLLQSARQPEAPQALVNAAEWLLSHDLFRVYALARKQLLEDQRLRHYHDFMDKISEDIFPADTFVLNLLDVV